MKRAETVHVVGVAGVGMNPLAQVALSRGYRVTGSDRYLDQGRTVPVLDQLARMGITLFPQDGSGITDRTQAVLVSTAIEQDNPDLEQARGLGVPVLHRAQALADWIGRDPCVAVAGTSGKTTVTGIAGWMLDVLGARPRVVNGGAVVNWRTPDRPGNVHMDGKGPWMVEVDESDKSLLNFAPDQAIITNISRDHFPLPETIDLFFAFARQVNSLLLTGPDVLPSLRALEERTEEPLPARCVEIMAEARLVPGENSFFYKDHRYTVRLPGKHNLLNALSAVALCDELGYEPVAMREALSAFQGIERRLEGVAEGGGIRVIDDYAHNPAKIAAAWSAVASSADRVLAVWRPHGFAPLAHMMDELEATFAEICGPADHLYLLPVFYAGGTTNRSIDSTELVDRLAARGVAVSAVDGYPALRKQLHGEMRAGDVVLCMGARDPDLPVFARSLLGPLDQDDLS